MNDVVDVLVPCETFTVTARVGPEDHLTELETLVMRAINRGVDTIPMLSELFGLAQRLTLDLVFDLWRTTLLTVDLTRGRVGLSAAAREAVRNGSFADLASGQARDRRLQVLQDQLTGHVMDPRQVPRPPVQPRAIVPVAMFEVGPQDMSRDQLVEALRSILTRGGANRQALKVLAADLAWDSLRPRQDRRLLRLRVRPSYDTQSGQLTLEVLPDPSLSLPAHTRSLMADRIALAVEAEPDANFSRWLLSEADERAAVAYDVSAELATLADRVARLEPSPAFAPQHDELVEIAGRVAIHAEEPAAPTFDVSLVAGREAQFDALTEIISRVERQLVIVSPWLGSKMVNSLIDPLEEIMRTRRAEVSVVWGISSGDETSSDEETAYNLFNGLAKSHPGQLRISRRSARTHAKIAIADDRVALVTSRNLLSGRLAGDDFELGVRVQGQPNLPCALIEELLHWTRETIPDYIHAQALCQHAEDFGRVVPPHARVLADRVGPSLRLPPPPASGDDESFDSAFRESILSVWVSAWREHVADLRSLIEPTREGSARMVRDGEHRDVLWNALRTARRRLLIVSDKLSSQVIEYAWLGALVDRLEHGVAVALAWSRHMDEEAVHQLRALEKQWTGQLVLVADTPNHAKAVVVDDTLTVGSFNFLSFEGMYRKPGTRGWRRDRREVSVEVHSRALAEATIATVQSAFAVDLGALLTAPPAEAPDARTDEAVASLPSELLALVPALAQAPDAHAQHRELRRAFHESADPITLITALHDAHLPADVSRMATAVFVTSRSGEPETAAWRAWLAVDAWKRGALLEAAVIADSLSEPPGAVVLPSVTACWQLLGDKSFGAAITDTALDVERDDDIAALVAVATVALIVHGEPLAPDALEVVRSKGPWQEIADLALAHWQVEFTGAPMRRIRDELGAASDREIVERTRLALVDALEKADREFVFAAGRETRGLLFAPDGVLGRLRAVVADTDTDGLRGWVAEQRRTDLGALLDKTALAASGDSAKLIFGGPRRTYLARLRAVWKAAREHANALGSSDDGRHAPVGPTLQALTHGVRDRWDVLEAEAFSDQPPAPLWRQLLPELLPLRRWDP